MATKFRQVGRGAGIIIGRKMNMPVNFVQPIRKMVYDESGALLQQPPQVKFGVFKVLAVTLPFLYGGATISKNAAAFLEENEIFVPDDDDD